MVVILAGAQHWGLGKMAQGSEDKSTDFKAYRRVQVYTSMKTKEKLDWLGGGWRKDTDPSLITRNSHSR